jgi:hypothetical protein
MFIKGFSKTTKPITELLRKDKKYKWTSACEVSFFRSRRSNQALPSVSNTCYGEVFLNLLLCIETRTRVCADARWSRGSVSFTTVKNA